MAKIKFNRDWVETALLELETMFETLSQTLLDSPVGSGPSDEHTEVNDDTAEEDAEAWLDVIYTASSAVTLKDMQHSSKGAAKKYIKAIIVEAKKIK